MACRRILPIALLGAGVLAAPAAGDVRDVRVSPIVDGAATVILDFAAPIGAASAAASVDGAVVMMVREPDSPSAFTAQSFQTRNAALVRAIDVAPDRDGAQVQLVSAVPILAARARVDGASVIVDLVMDAGAGSPSSSAGRPPPADPVRAPTTPDGATASPSPRPTTDVNPAADPNPTDDVPDYVSVEEPPKPPVDAEPLRLFAGALTPETCAEAEAAVREDAWSDALATFGACVALDGRPDEAREVFSRLLSFSPDDPEAHLGLGAVVHAAGDPEAARSHYQDALLAARTDDEAARARVLLEAVEN